jgi:hypothetical protein
MMMILSSRRCSHQGDEAATRFSTSIMEIVAAAQVGDDGAVERGRRPDRTVGLQSGDSSRVSGRRRSGRCTMPTLGPADLPDALARWQQLEHDAAMGGAREVWKFEVLLDGNEAASDQT